MSSMEQKWRTSIGYADKDKTIIRGYTLDDLLMKHSFSDIIFLEWTGKLPTKAESAVFNAILSAGIEHGMNPPSILGARIAYSGSGSFLQALSAGILSTGQFHGAAGEYAAKIFQEQISKSPKDVVVEFAKRGERLPGFGHKQYKEEDPRVTRLVALAKKQKLSLKHVEFAYAIQKELEKQTGKQLPLNIDGGVAALLSDLGIHWRFGSAAFVIPRAFGIAAHVVEEATMEKPFRRLDDNEIEYAGKKL